MEGKQGNPSMLFDNVDAIGCMANPKEITEKPCALSSKVGKAT
jgi:hypothetical protein